jgi:hypothetical protein
MYGLTGSAYRRTPFRKVNASGNVSTLPDSLGAMRSVRHMPQYYTSNANDSCSISVTYDTSTPLQANINNSNAWSTIGNSRAGVQIDTDFISNTYKTLLNVSGGGGEVTHIIGPAITGGSVTLDLEVTLDGGTPEVVSYAPPTSTVLARLVVGSLRYSNVKGSLNTPLAGNKVVDFTTTVAQSNTPSPVLFSPMSTRAYNGPRLRFNSSVLIRMRTSASVTGTVNCERRSGVMYVLD